MTGDQSDMFGRIKRLIPATWFGAVTETVDALIQGLASPMSFVYALYLYAKLQTRILTATDAWLDLTAADFFGSSLQRMSNQTDASFRAQIIINLFRERGTRNAIRQVLYDLTGREPVIFEPQRPLDTGGYGVAGGFGITGGYGSILLPYQGFVRAFRPVGAGIPYVAGYGIPTGAYSTASQSELASIDMAHGITDQNIYDAINSVKPEGTIVWTNISS